MKHLSIRAKLVFLSTFLLSLTILVGGVQFYGARHLMSKFEIITGTDMPAIHKMTLVDMMHDGIRAVVYRSLFLSTNGDETVRREAQEEFKEMAGHMREYISEINTLKLNAKVKKAIAKSLPSIEEYIKNSEEVVNLALTGKVTLALVELEKCEGAFHVLEADLEELGNLIESTSKTTDKEAKEAKSTVMWLGIAIIIIGVLLGSLLALLLVRDLAKSLTNMIQSLSQASHEISSASKESATAATHLSEAATEQAASLQETMASVEEISAMVTQNVESSQKAKGAVESNQKASDQGQKSVEEMLRSIADIKDINDKILGQMEASNREFGEIVKIISEIEDKTKVINDIVFQTKLLSFNASVEAARAGEHGKGFAVVAEEVGNLAQMSGNAAKQISEMLSSSIRKVNDIVDQTTRRVDELVEVGKDRIVAGQSTVQKCQDALGLISESAHTVGTMVAEIANASKEQAQGVQEINKAITQLDQVTQQNSTIARHSSDQSDRLFSQSQSLEGSVDGLVQLVNGQQIVPQATSTRVPERNESVARMDDYRSTKKTVPTKNTAVPKVTKKIAKSSALEVPHATDEHFEDF